MSAKDFNASPRQECKIPILTINATCLNTGHPFHFTGAWVGEPARPQYAQEQNSNVVLPQLRFDGSYQDDPQHKITESQSRKLQQLTLSDAVAASAAVPGIFPPLPIHDLYRNSNDEEIVVELSDGGVFDNQGLDALFSAHCTKIIVSNASGQLEDERLLATDLLHTAQRANDVMMERIRGSGYLNLWTRGQACRYLTSSDPTGKKFLADYCFIEGGSFMHLREEAPNTPNIPGLPGPVNRSTGLVYRISGLRTDLDAFSDLEADALMYHGYTLTQTKLSATGMSANVVYTPAQPWRFLGIAQMLKSSEGPYHLLRHLKAGKNQFFKSFRVAAGASWAWLVFLLSPVVFYGGLWLYLNRNATLFLTPPSLTWSELARDIVIAIIALLPISSKVRALFKTIPWLRPAKENPATNALSAVFGLVVTGIALLSSLTIFVWLHTYNEIFLKAGRYWK